MEGDIVVVSEQGKGSEFQFSFKYEVGQESKLSDHIKMLKVEA